MFTADAIWGLDIGDSSIKAVRLSSSKGDIFVDDYGKVELDEKTKKGDGYLAAVSKAIEKLTSKKDFSKTEVCISISAKNANSQFITLDSGLSKKQFNEEILDEAEKQIPFPLEEVEWGIHKMEEGEDDVQVALFAARSEHVNSLLEVTEAAGLDVRGIQVPGVALYNFVSELTDVEDHLVLLDFGEKSTGLLLVYDQQFWLRSLPLSGAHITNLLEKKFRITTSEANTLKMEMEKSPQRDKLFRVIEPKLKELVIEIKRSINFRRTQAKELAPKQFLAWGGSSMLPGVADYFTDKLGLKACELNLDAFDFSNCDNPKNLKGNIPSYGVAFGLAIQGLGGGVSELNLAPKAYVRQNILKTKRLSFLVVALALLAVSIVSMLSHEAVSLKLKALDKRVSAQKSQLQREISKFDAASKAESPKKAELDYYKKVLNGDLVMPKVYHAVMEVLSSVENVYLTSLSVSPLTVAHLMGGGDALAPIELKLSYAGDSARSNRLFSTKLLEHPFFVIKDGDERPQISGLQKDFKWSFSPKVQVVDHPILPEDPEELVALRESKGWTFESQGELVEEPIKMNVQTMVLKLDVSRFMNNSALADNLAKEED